MSAQILEGQIERERECVHRRSGVTGVFIPGERYIQALQSLRGEAAMTLSRKVSPFFWADAALTKVWLCSDCARDARI
jgi:hypothetical protein